MPLNEKHLADLRSSGLNDDTITRLGFYSADEKEIMDTIKPKGGMPLGPGMIIPYPIFSGYKRAKLDKKKIKPNGEEKSWYMQPTGAINRFYIPFDLNTVKDEVSKPLIITEGEKKAAKASQEGFPCIAIGGVWNWKSKKSPEDKETFPLQDFDMVNWNGRKVYVIFDNDYRDKPDIKKAGEKLREELVKRGAYVYLRFIPDLPELKGKGGLDDMLVLKGNESLVKLMELSNVLPEVVRNFEITSIIRRHTQPITYIVNINGKDISVSSKDLLSYNEFKAIVLEKINRVIFVDRPQRNWDPLIDAYLTSNLFSNEDAPEESDKDSNIRDSINDYLKFHKTDSQEKFLQDPTSVLVKDGHMMAHGKEIKYSVQKSIKWAEPKHIWNVFRDMGGTMVAKRIKDRVMNLWVFPDSVAEDAEPKAEGALDDF